jgi:hypothetical protein
MRHIAKFALIALVLTCLPVLRLRADAFVPYPTPGLENPVTYTFTAASTGDIIAYFVNGAGAGFTNRLGLLVNGTDTGIYGLQNHSTPFGTALNFGPANLGDTLTFVMRNDVPGIGDVFSNPALNAPYDGTPTGHNHVYSTTYLADGSTAIAAGVYTYVGFEDLPADGSFNGPDYNYIDEAFVFSNVASSAPLPSTALCGSVLLAALWFTRRALRQIAAA